MSSCPLMLPGIRSSVVFLDFGFKPLAFSLILTVTSRLLHPYSTDDKTSRLMVKVESEKLGLKLNIQKTKIMASGPVAS